MYINLDRKLWKSLTAEFVGCFFLNFFGCGACVASNCYGFGPADDAKNHFPAGDIALCAAFAFGGVIVVNIVIIGPVSGCQINPAVTIGFMTVGMMPIPRGLLYIVVQVLGCLAGTGTLSVFATGTSLNPARTLGSAIVSEEYTNVWVYCTAPTLGAVLAAQGYHWVLKDRKKPGEFVG